MRLPRGPLTLWRRPLSSFLITTPIFYVNASPHIGHLYSALLADAQRRFRILRNEGDVFLCTGTDEHGLKIQQAAANQGSEVGQFCAYISKSYSTCFKQFGVEWSDFIRTTESRHHLAVEHFWTELMKRGHLYKTFYQGWYCVQDETFLSEHQITMTPDGTKVSLQSGHPVEWAQEENYMFRMSDFKDRIISWLSQNDVIQPALFVRQLQKTLHAEDLPDLSVSRSSSRLQWGIPVPGDASQTIYVWLDALINYLTVCGYPDNVDRLWPAKYHVVGKDILKFHAVYWAAFLMAAHLPLPEKILCHSHWTVDDQKMSKSKGNVIDPSSLVQTFSSEGVRYFLLREGVPHSDGNFTTLKMAKYLNSELANTLGNLLGRVTSQTVNKKQHFPGYDADLMSSLVSPEGREVMASVETLAGIVGDHFLQFNYYLGVDATMECLRKVNAFVQKEEPWTLSKMGKEEQLRVVLHLSMEALRVCGIVLQPIVPKISRALLDKLGVAEDARTWSDAETVSWKCQRSKSEDTPLSAQTTILFHKIK